MGRFQFVWRGDTRYWAVGSRGPWPLSGRNRGSIYRWRFQVGPLEVRRWAEQGEGLS